MKKNVLCMLLALLLAFSLCPAQGDSLFPMLPSPAEVKVFSFGSMKMVTPDTTEILLDGSIYGVYTSVTHQDYYDFGTLLSNEGYLLDGQETVEGGVKLNVSHGNARFTLTYYMYKFRMELLYPAGSVFKSIAETQYAMGEAQLAAGQYAEAANAFARSVGYLDGLKRAWNIRYQYLQEGVIASNYYDSKVTTFAVQKDGTVIATSETVALLVKGWTDIVAVAEGNEYVVGLKCDGTVVAAGRNDKGQLNVEQWTDIVAIDAFADVTVGLKSDGTAVAAGDNDKRQCNVGLWEDIIAVDVYYSITYGLKKDGTLADTGRYRHRTMDDKAEAFVSIRDSLAMYQDGSHTRVLSSGQANEYYVPSWMDMAMVLNGAIGLKKDGTLLTEWDGASYRYNEHGECDVASWTDVVCICTNRVTTYGVKSDGTVLATGLSDDNACNVDTWRNIGHGDNLLQ